MNLKNQQQLLSRTMQIGTILVIAWLLMLGLFIALDTTIVPLQGENKVESFVLGTFKVACAGVGFLAWLFIWKKVIELYFWNKIANAPQEVE